ncbi:MAG: hypothetical protein N2712_01115 [Brevinematales bacterium]|nr:hypothetical protein [Brevinematales bacterium]
MKNIIVFFLMVVLMSGCGIAVRESKEQIDKMDIDDVYRLAIKYYSEGYVREAEFLYEEVIRKYSDIKEPSDALTRVYLWSIYELGFINYLNNNYDKSKYYLELLFEKSGSFGDRIPQVVLGRRLYSKMKRGF